MKAEFLFDTVAVPYVHYWFEACRELSDVSATPWLLYSISVDYESNISHSRVACLAGAVGVDSRRVIWKEAVELNGGYWLNFLKSIVTIRRERMEELCYALGKPWQIFNNSWEYSGVWNA